MDSGGIYGYVKEQLRAARIVDVGVDYLTVTTSNDAAKRNLFGVYTRGVAQAERLGDARKKAGFQGFMGEQCGPWFYGRREELWLLRISGPVAGDSFHDLPWPALNCSRIDLQITVQLPAYVGTIAEDIGAARFQAATSRKIKLIPAQDLKVKYGNGDTLYIGSRESPRFGRIYDKDKQSKDERYANCWRFEIEYKKVVAPEIVRYLLQEKELAPAVGAAVTGQLEAWGVPTHFGYPNRLVAGSIGRREYDSERSMKWLREQVAPTIEKLLATVDRESIEEALGLREAPQGALPPMTQAWEAETQQPALGAAGGAVGYPRDWKW